ncbi:hypothetical protein [Novosphingobium sp.]|uniref:hypothetical protein n=1 Tax=Novosphingobium sp. TaxID=1874826 RepID=UPI002623D2D9|nr:hypothetical protein [Novosphingobium sp.]
MSDDTEEQLAAFLDGAMDDEAAAAFEARLAADPALAAKAELWLANDRRIAAAFAPLAEAPISPELLARMGLTSERAAAVRTPGAANDNPPWWRRYNVPLGAAVAASLVAALVLPRDASEPTRDLSFALETGRSLEAVRLADGSTVTPTLTVKAADGRWCREYRQGAAIGLACRDDGSWKVEATGSGTGPADGGEIGVASGADSAPLAPAFARIGASDPLGNREEDDLITRGWQAR